MPRGQCENCGCSIPDNQWCCLECFPFFDGEKFLDPDECEITIITKLGGDDGN